MEETFTPSRFEDAPAMTLAGLRRAYTFDNRGEIPELWEGFGPAYFGKVPGQVGRVAYGVCEKNDDPRGFDYAAAIQVADASGLPSEFVTMEFPAQRYAVFVHPGALSTLMNTIDGMFQSWLPASEFEMTGQPMFFERYGEKFDPATRSGDIELWMPVKKKAS